MKGSSGGYMTFSTVKGQSMTGATVSASGFSLNMSSDVCRGGSAGSSWGFREMGTQWTVRNLDLTAYGGTSIYYIVGDATAASAEYEFRVPPAPGATANITIVMCAFAPPRPPRADRAFSQRVGVRRPGFFCSRRQPFLAGWPGVGR